MIDFLNKLLYNIEMLEKFNTTDDILNKKIKVLLYTIGLSEKYAAFDYLSIILTHLIKNKNESVDCFKQAINIIMEKYQLTSRSITQSLNKLLNMCSKNEITNKQQFHIVNNSTLNKIRVVKSYIESKI